MTADAGRVMTSSQCDLLLSISLQMSLVNDVSQKSAHRVNKGSAM